MNAGLSNLATLKAWLLPTGMLAGTDYDDQILAIGKGVAGQLEQHCNRLFLRSVGDTFECNADRMHVSLPRYPVESVASVALQTDLTTGFVAQTDPIQNQSLIAGLLYFAGMMGVSSERMRVTYTAGYWFEPLEPADVSFPTTPPVGAALVPDVLQLAWKIQCEHVWQQRDKLGLSIGDKPSATPAIVQLDLLPVVSKLTQPFRRFTLI